MAIGHQLKSQEQDQEQSTQQKQSEVKLVPYVQVEGEWILPEDFLDSIFDKIVEQGLLKTTFWEGHVTDASHFEKLVKNPSNYVVFFFEQRTCVGLAWLSGVSGNFAFGHFCLFREVWGRSNEIGRTCVNYWLSWPGTDGPLLDVIIGIMPGFNQRAHKFIARLGFTRLGVIPGMFRDTERNREDAVIYYLSR